MDIRRAQTDDFEDMVTLQNANLATNLSDEQKRDGFLSGSFGAQQFAEMNRDLAVIVGVEEQTVKAFLCATTVQFNKSFALPKAMIDRFPIALYGAKRLSDWSVCITGPVCIDASLRGKGVLKKLYECFYTNVPAEYELAVVFVSAENTRSIKAHEKLTMQTIDKFDFNSHRYVIMANRISSH